MRLLDTVITRPILAASFNLLLIAVGIGAILSLPIREFPDVDPPSVTVNTIYRGAQAEVVEREVTRIIEENLSGIAGIRQIRSTTRDENSDIDLEFLAGTDIDAAAADVRDKVSAVRNDLPDLVEEPVIEKASADDQPMMYLTVRSDEYDTAALTDLVDRTVVDAIGAVSGVSQVQIGGEKRYAMRIWLDRRAMAARGVTAGDVSARLEAENIELPAGELETATQAITLRADTRFASADEFRELSLVDRGGQRVRLGDVATVEVGVEDRNSGFRVDGGDAISLGVVRQSNANTLEIAQGVIRELESVRGQIPASVEIAVGYNEAVFIRENLANVASTLLQTVAVIVVVIFVFLGSVRSTVIPAATIPASVIPAAIVAVALGFSLNALTILAVILAISLCTDDAVVIMENIRRRQQAGEPLLLAAARATRQVGFAVFASALVLIAVILPLAFLGGNVGLLFREFAVVLAAIVAFSTTAALTLAPMLSSKLFADRSEPTRMERFVGARLERLGRGYKRVLGAAVRHVWLTLLAGLAFAGIGVLAFGAVPAELAPDEDRGAIIVRAEGPEGASPAYMSEKMRALEAVVRRANGEDGPLRAILTVLSPGRTGQGQPTVGILIVQLRDWADRDETQMAFQERLQDELPAVTGVRAFAINPNGLGQGGGRPVSIVVKGPDRAVLDAWSQRIVEAGRSIPGLVNLDSDYDDTKPQIRVGLDRSRASALGVDARAIGETLQIMFGEAEVTRYVERGEEYEVILQARADDRLTPGDIDNVFVRAGGGELIPLSSVVTREETGTVRELERLDRQPSITIGANLSPRLSLGDALGQLERIARDTQPAGTEIAYTGQSLDFQETGSAVLFILAMILVLVYLLLAGQFESFVHPLVILIAAPAALAGGVLILWAMGQTLNIYSQIAMLLLIGLVAKNAILLVEFANQLREEGAEPFEAAVEAAGQRLRPILMTTLATILGAVPLLLESGAGAEARTTVGAVIAAGTTLGTALTLFVVPALYVLLSRFSPPRNALEAELGRLEREHPAEGRAEPAE
ncbi:efflux RND transporter permease subunit [Aureimonas flava]|uniref:Efflux RND transporter permease subunit n=1 Tax=Aureimonas flava TaxID=2320271 RepID=A0A3A1WPQ1_9HYPH|nr:efflux RND transporter permease subunit [Aureimonas flava]RIX98451.1 efflux RND transporter permease subunit [Aureimonas flava]